MSMKSILKDSKPEEEIVILKTLNYKLEAELSRIRKSRNSIVETRAKDIIIYIKELIQFIQNSINKLPIPESLKDANLPPMDDLSDEILNILRFAKSDIDLLVTHIFQVYDNISRKDEQIESLKSEMNVFFYFLTIESTCRKRRKIH